jgi:hypothetical protein
VARNEDAARRTTRRPGIPDADRELIVSEPLAETRILRPSDPLCSEPLCCRRERRDPSHARPSSKPGGPSQLGTVTLRVVTSPRAGDVLRRTALIDARRWGRSTIGSPWRSRALRLDRTGRQRAFTLCVICSRWSIRMTRTRPIENCLAHLFRPLPASDDGYTAVVLFAHARGHLIDGKAFETISFGEMRRFLARPQVRRDSQTHKEEGHCNANGYQVVSPLGHLHSASLPSWQHCGAFGQTARDWNHILSGHGSSIARA